MRGRQTRDLGIIGFDIRQVWQVACGTDIDDRQTRLANDFGRFRRLNASDHAIAVPVS